MSTSKHTQEFVSPEKISGDVNAEVTLLLSKEWHVTDWAERARHIAEAAHDGDTDKNGEPIIDHVTRVVEAVKRSAWSLSYKDRQAVIAAAWMHDVVEDGHADLFDIATSFPGEVAPMLNALTRRENETYADYIGRVRRSSTHAVLIKIADLRDNLRRPGADSLKPRYTKALASIEGDLT